MGYQSESGTDQDNVAIYLADMVENSDNVSLTRGGLILVALLVGGDYDLGVGQCRPRDRPWFGQVWIR